MSILDKDDYPKDTTVAMRLHGNGDPGYFVGWTRKSADDIRTSDFGLVHGNISFKEIRDILDRIRMRLDRSEKYVSEEKEINGA